MNVHIEEESVEAFIMTVMVFSGASIAIENGNLSM